MCDIDSKGSLLGDTGSSTQSSVTAQRAGTERETGGGVEGLRREGACIPAADACWCMAEASTIL